MGEAILEVVVTSAEEARAAVAGGAHRLELAADMEAQGTTPALAEYVRTRDAVTVPVRVMLRDKGGFQAADLDALRAAAGALRAAGAEEFVLGFLTTDGAPDLPAVHALLDVLPGCRWTFHRAVDHAADRTAVRLAIEGLPGLDTLLTAGSVAGVAEGLPTLLAEADRQGEPGHTLAVMAGGGLGAEHVPALRARGVDAFHVGTSVRQGGWDSPVEPAAVRRWRELIDAAAPEEGG